MTILLDTEPDLLCRMPSAGKPGLRSLCLGETPLLSLVLSAALGGHDREPSERDGFLMACEPWPDDVPPVDVLDRLDRCDLHGKPVGLIAVAADVGCAARTLALVRVLVRRRGGLLLGGSLCLDSTDMVPTEGDCTFADSTIPARLALLAERVRVFARNRRILLVG